MISHGVEISIARGVGKMVRAIFLARFYIFYFFLFFLYYVFIVTVQELACSASYGVNKTSISIHSNKGKPIAARLQVCQVLDTSPNIQLTKESKVTVTAEQPSHYERKVIHHRKNLIEDGEGRRQVGPLGGVPTGEEGNTMEGGEGGADRVMSGGMLCRLT